jgi:lysine biosynthesis protein LysW
MKLVCPECKNDINLTNYPDLADGHIVECNHCGITLEVKEVGENLVAEVVDEGK